METKFSLQCSQQSANSKLCETFRKMLVSFYGEDLLVLRPKPKAQDRNYMLMNSKERTQRNQVLEHKSAWGWHQRN